MRMALDLAAEFQALIQTLEDAGVDYAVVGAFALAIWGAPRATSDIDLLTEPEDAERILDIAEKLGFRLKALPLSFRDGMQLRRVTKVASGDSITLDLLLVNESLAPVFASRQHVDTEFGPVRVISRDALISMKAAANRPQDIADIERLQDLDR